MGGGQLVLVVEDDEDVRRLTVDILIELGYSILSANGSVQALSLLDTHPNIVLLMTDVVMPADRCEAPPAAPLAAFSGIGKRRFGGSILSQSSALPHGAPVWRQICSQTLGLDQARCRVPGALVESAMLAALPRAAPAP